MNVDGPYGLLVFAVLITSLFGVMLIAVRSTEPTVRRISQAICLGFLFLYVLGVARTAWNFSSFSYLPLPDKKDKKATSAYLAKKSRLQAEASYVEMFSIVLLFAMSGLCLLRLQKRHENGSQEEPATVQPTSSQSTAVAASTGKGRSPLGFLFRKKAAHVPKGWEVWHNPNW